MQLFIAAFLLQKNNLKYYNKMCNKNIKSVTNKMKGEVNGKVIGRIIFKIP